MKEVKSYLEYKQSVFNPEFANMLNKLGFKNDDEFYSQAFTPELIEKYFEGWVADEFPIFGNSKALYIRYNKGEHQVRIEGDNHSMLYENNIDEKAKRWYFPSTLDRFICHCQDAGIKLYWKEVKG